MKKKKKVYISGSMSKLPREEYMAHFAKAEKELRAAGYATVNPARFLVCKYRWLYRIVGYRLTLLYDLWRLSRCDLIYKIPGWRESRGAQIESAWAWNTHMWALPPKLRARIDKRVAKFIEKRKPNPKDTPAPPTPAPRKILSLKAMSLGKHGERLPEPECDYGKETDSDGC